jgi:hypothetical protein
MFTKGWVTLDSLWVAVRGCKCQLVDFARRHLESARAARIWHGAGLSTDDLPITEGVPFAA